MQWLYLFLMLGALAGAAAWWGNTQRRWKIKDKLGRASFRIEPLLVNASERAAWDFLNQTDLGQAHVFAKVRIEDVVSAHAPEHGEKNAARGYIKSRHFDFVLTDSDFRPILIVEVDGSSHRNEQAATVDELKNQILASACLPLLRLRVGADWNKAVANWQREQAESAASKEGGGDSRARSRH